MKITEPVIPRPEKPVGDNIVWYRGWECGFNEMASRYTLEGWIAYKGGADLDAPTVTASSWHALLDGIDTEEDDG